MTGEFHLMRSQHKKKWAAYILNLIFPGVGLLYWRRATSGLYWLILSLSVSVSLICYWMLVPFLPQLLIILLILYWFFAQLILFEKINKAPATAVTWSRGSNNLPAFFGLAILSLALVSLVIYIGMTRVYSFVYVRDMSMYPHLLKGDILLVDRRVQENNTFEIGEVIAYDSLTNGTTISRVIASSLEAKRVEVLGAQVNLDDKSLFLQPVEMKIDYFSEKEYQLSEYHQFYEEYPLVNNDLRTKTGNDEAKKKKWLISEPLDYSKGRLSLTGHLGKNTLLVLPDVRMPNNGEFGHHGEIIDQSRIIGRPLMIISSSYEHRSAQKRKGLKVY